MQIPAAEGWDARRGEADRREFPARYRRCEQVKAISVVFRPNANTVCQRLGRGACNTIDQRNPGSFFLEGGIGCTMKEKLLRYDGSVSSSKGVLILRRGIQGGFVNDYVNRRNWEERIIVDNFGKILFFIFLRNMTCKNSI